MHKNTIPSAFYLKDHIFVGLEYSYKNDINKEI